MNLKKVLTLTYDSTSIFLCFISVALVVLSFCIKEMSLGDPVFKIVLRILLYFFSLDLIIRFEYANNKRKFITGNIMLILSVIPTFSAFSILRIGRMSSLCGKYHLLRKMGLNPKFSNQLDNFIYKSGVINLLVASSTILILSSLGYSFTEHVSMAKSIWWAISTATTVGYGDVSPKTNIGKLISSFLMVGGIGFIGLLTSTITEFFTSDEFKNEDNNIEVLSDKIDELTNKIDNLEKININKNYDKNIK